MKEKTRAYAKRAAAIAQEICGNSNHPWKKDAHLSPWKLRLIDLEGDRRGLVCDDESEKVRNLLLDWESTRKEGAVGERNRYVILLEDLSPRIAELLGVLLDIPPEFFFSHCNDGDSELSVVDKQLSKRGSSKYWKVAVPQQRTMSQAPERGRCTISCGSFDRGSISSDDASSLDFEFNSYVSYWANSYGDGSWISVSPSFDVMSKY